MSKPLLRHRVNPCDIDRLPSLAPLGNALALFYAKAFEEPTHGCPCCKAIRIILLTTVAYCVGFYIGLEA